MVGLVESLVDEIEGTVGQAAKASQEQLVEGAGVDDGPLEGHALDMNGLQGGVFLAAGEDEIEDAFRLGAQADGDLLVAEQVLEQARVAIDRHPLEGVLEVAVVPGDEHGHARGHRGIHFLGSEAPLLLGIVEEHVLVDEVRHLLKLRILLGAQLVDGDLALVAEGVDELLDEPGRLLVAEGNFHRVLVEGHGHVGAIPIGKHPVLVARPLGEAGKIVVGALIVGMEDVRPVAVHEHPGLVVLVVHVAGDVRALLDDEHAKTALFGKLPGTDSPGKTGADNDGVVVFDGDIAEIGVINGHNGFSPSYSLMRMGRRRSGGVVRRILYPARIRWPPNPIQTE